MLRQEAESRRERCEFAKNRETASNTARSRWGGPRREDAVLPVAEGKKLDCRVAALLATKLSQ